MKKQKTILGTMGKDVLSTLAYRLVFPPIPLLAFVVVAVGAVYVDVPRLFQRIRECTHVENNLALSASLFRPTTSQIVLDHSHCSYTYKKE